MREVAAEFERTILLFSGGKDSILMVHLAAKAFAPGNMPFPLIHIDTGHNFPETIQYRDALVTKLGATLHVGSVQASIDSGRVQEETGPNPSRNRLQTVTLLDTLAEQKADAATRRRPAPRSASSATGTASGSGIRRTSALSCGTSSTAARTPASTSASSPSPTGPRWTCGSTSPRRR